MPPKLDDKGYGYWAPDVGSEWSPNHPIRSGEMPDAEQIEKMTFGEWLKRHPVDHEE